MHAARQPIPLPWGARMQRAHLCSEGPGVARMERRACLVPREQHVGGGEVAVQDGLGVKIRQRVSNLLCLKGLATVW